jgi:hypothetical protein
LTGLKHGLPFLGSAVAGVLGDALSQAATARLDLSCKLLDELPGLPSDDATAALEEYRHPPRSTADFAELRESLIALDPEFGGLRERELPESRGVAYLCQHHREALRYPARSTPGQLQ